MGVSNTSIEAEVALQPIVVFVKVNVTLPALMPVITPAFVIVAIAVLLLIQVPPEAGNNECVSLTQRLLLRGKFPMVGKALIVTVFVVLLHPVDVLVYENVTVPAPTGVISPLFNIVATPILLLLQVPPADGVAKCELSSTQNAKELTSTTGKAPTTIDKVLLCVGSQAVRSVVILTNML